MEHSRNLVPESTASQSRMVRVLLGDQLTLPGRSVSMAADYELFAILGVAVSCGCVFYTVVARSLLVR